MRENPNFSGVAALIGDPARAYMLTSLLDGRALTASELAIEAGITKQTVSAHVAKLVEGGLLDREVQGRHHYFRLSGKDVADVLKALMGLADKMPDPRVRPGPKDAALRKARVCYNHLAGEMGVDLFDKMKVLGWFNLKDEFPALMPSGLKALAEFGLNIKGLQNQRRPMCRSCLDWSIRRHHLAGSVGQALLERFVEKGWATRASDTRIIEFSVRGEQQFNGWLAE